MTHKTVKVQIKNLRKGDILFGSGTYIGCSPFDQVGTPQGKINLIVRNSNGYERQVVWNKRTVVSVLVDDEFEQY